MNSPAHIEVALSLHEVLIAANVGVRRRLAIIKDRSPDMYGQKPEHDGWQCHIEGSGAELAVAKHFDLFWSGHVGDYKAFDVGPYEVRQTPHHNGHLILQHKDLDKGDAPCILVTGSTPVFRLAGWIYGFEGLVNKYYTDKPRNGRPAFWIPQSDLRPMSSLPPPAR